MTNKEIFEIAMKQSAIDSNCDPADFVQTENKVVISGCNPHARAYLKLPFNCDLTSYGNNIVASTNVELADIVSCYIDKYPIEHCFETPNMHTLNVELEKNGLQVCFMAEYFLPDVNELKPLECNYEIQVLSPDDFAGCYTESFSNALCSDRKHLDVLAVGAYDGEGHVIGLAGCSSDCETMWQIGVDVLPEYRRQGIAAALTTKIALEIIKRGKVPFYCAAWSNIKSVRNAIKSGFRPAWVQMTAKPIEFVTDMNK